MKALLDANVLVALFDADNKYHDIAEKWFLDFICEPNNVWLSCAITQMACLRVLSLPSYPKHFTFAEIQQILQGAMLASNHQFLVEEMNLVLDEVLDWRHLQGHRQLTDAYLLALAVANQAVFVTFDSRINYRIVKDATPDHLLTLEI